jgi:peroxiredoxin
MRFIFLFLTLLNCPIFAQNDAFSIKNRDTLVTLSGDSTVFELTDFFEKNKRLLLDQPVFDFGYRDTNGQPVFLSDFAGRIRLLYFGDIWHDQCLIDFEILNNLMKKYQKSGLRTMVLTTNEATQFGERVRPEKFMFPFLVNTELTFFNMEMGGGLGYPRLFLVDKSSVIRAILDSQSNLPPALQEENWEKQIVEFLKQK